MLQTCAQREKFWHIGKLVLGIIVWKPAKSAGTKETLPCSGRRTCMGAKAVWSESHLRGWFSIVSGHLSVMSEFSYGARYSIGNWQPRLPLGSNSLLAWSIQDDLTILEFSLYTDLFSMSVPHAALLLLLDFNQWTSSAKTFSVLECTEEQIYRKCPSLKKIWPPSFLLQKMSLSVILLCL